MSGIGEELNKHLVEKIRNKVFAIQIDEATDGTKDAHLITYVRYVGEDNIKEDLVLCKEIRETSKAEELFNNIDSYMTTNLLEGSNCMGVLDAAYSVSDIRGGLQVLIYRKFLVLWSHCTIHT
jgi:hypothetical protein